MTWSHDQDPNGSYTYEIWRNLTQDPVPSGTWELIIATSNLNYLDNDIYIGDGSWGKAFYKVRAKIDELKSSYSNLVSIDFEGVQKNAATEYHESIIIDYLSQNIPNPFNPATTITYSIAQKSHVNLRVYNSLGQEIAMPVDETMSEGEYSVKFDAGKLPSGVYFYKLETDYLTDVKKMVVAK